MKTLTAIGSGLVCLDILLRGNDDNAVSYTAGGTCGNVMMILSYMGWQTYPMARLDKSEWGRMLLDDMRKYNVREDFITTDNGKTPVIVQRNIIDRYGNPTHKFESHEKRGGRFFLDYKAVTKKEAQHIIDTLSFVPDVFFFDRITPANILLAEAFRNRGSLVYFEPSVRVVDNKFLQCVTLSHIVKFADQRIQDTSFTQQHTDKLFIQTMGAKGLQYSLFGQPWQQLPGTPCPNVVDSSGAGDWTTAMFLQQLCDKQTFLTLTTAQLNTMLTLAQKVASRSCSYESARGLMAENFEDLKRL